MKVDLNLVKELRNRTGLGMNNCKKAAEEADGDVEKAIDLLKQWGELRGKELETRAAVEGVIGIYANNSASVVGIYEVNCQTDFTARNEEFIELTYLLGDKMNSFSEEKFEAARKMFAAKTGENIILRRKAEFHNTTPYSYIAWYNHPGSKLSSVVEISMQTDEAWRTNFNVWKEFANDLAMHIAAAAPMVVNKDEIPAGMIARQRAIFTAQLAEDKKPKASWDKIIDGKFAKWRKDIVLLEQNSIREPNKTIDQLRQEAGKKINGDIKIIRFVRYALGEDK